MTLRWRVNPEDMQVVTDEWFDWCVCLDRDLYLDGTIEVSTFEALLDWEFRGLLPVPEQQEIMLALLAPDGSTLLDCDEFTRVFECGAMRYA